MATRSTLPVLANVFLEADRADQTLRVAATDLERGISVSVDAEITGGGATTVPAGVFTDLVKQSDGETVEITLDPATHELSYVCGRVTARLKGIDAEEFPLLPTYDDRKGAEGYTAVDVPAPALARMIDRTAFAAAADQSRPTLTGVFFGLGPVEDGSEHAVLTTVAADGFRLSVCREVVEADVADDLHLIVPARGLSDVATIIDAGVVRIATNPYRDIVFQVDGAATVEIVSQLIEGNFPDYTTIVPDSWETEVVVDARAFERATRRAMIYARDVAGIVRLTVDEGMLVVAAEATEMGATREPVPATVEGPELETAYNGKYLLAALRHIDGEVRMRLTGPSAPGLFVPADDTGQFQHVIMPMHIGGQ